ncbi:ribose 5-phosphate isomerase B [Mycoplasmatota bacterium]|nr:ribose 5-phosphate isomerase B [Mycoplasmatota bacterium]
MKIAMASDHAGFELKEAVKNYLNNQKIEVEDLGTYSLDSVDYPDYGKKLGVAVMSGSYDFGIAICGTGIGISIAANKVHGIRAALIYDKTTARLAKEHNNANVIALGGRLLSKEEAYKLVDAFMHASFEERHLKRLNKINEIEES